MAKSMNLVALSVLVFLLAVANGQEEDLSCSDADINSGHYSKASKQFCSAYIRCDINKRGVLSFCPTGTVYDSTSGICNFPEMSTCSLLSCGSNPTSTYPEPCSDSYVACITGASTGLQIKQCPTGQTYSRTAGGCGNYNVQDSKYCSRPSTVPYNSNAPVSNCSLIPVDGKPCQFKTRVNGFDFEPQLCADGTEFNQRVCGCIHSTQCFRNDSNKSSKTKDPNCGATWLLNFKNVVNGIPQVYKEISGFLVPILSYVESHNVEYANDMATFTQGLNSNNASFLYAHGFTANQLNVPVYAQFILKASSLIANGQNFNIWKNVKDIYCTATISLTANYNNNQYTFMLTISGANDGATAGQITNTGSLTVLLPASFSDWVQVVVEFNGQANLHACNLGPNKDFPTAGAQIIRPPQPTARLGDRVAFNSCGFEFFKGFTGQSTKIAFYEGCTNPTKGQNIKN